jgi:hypothetical protein
LQPFNQDVIRRFVPILGQQTIRAILQCGYSLTVGFPFIGSLFLVIASSWLASMRRERI